MDKLFDGIGRTSAKPVKSPKRRHTSGFDANGVRKGLPGSKLARKAAKGSVGLYGGRRGLIPAGR